MCCLFYYFAHLLTDSQNSAVGSGSPSQSLVQIHKVQLCDIHPSEWSFRQATCPSVTRPLTFGGWFFFKASSILTSISHNLNGFALQINLMLYL